MTGPKAHQQPKTNAPRHCGPHPARVARLASAGLITALAGALGMPALAVVGASTGAAASTFPAGPGPAQAGQARAAGSAASTATRLMAWGYNYYGEIGDGTTTPRDVPVRVKLPKGTTVTQVRAGCSHSLALTSQGQVLAWGDNSHGSLGNGRTASSGTPVRVKIPNGTKITAVRAGCRFSVALTAKGQVLTWGDNTFGELGTGRKAGSDIPVRVKLPRRTKVTAITVGWDFAAARTSAGQVLSWGDNMSGQLGNGRTTGSRLPVKVKLPSRAKVTALAAGGGHVLALTSAGLFAWGLNAFGQLGDGTTTSSDRPVKVEILLRGPGLGHVTSLFAGCDHSLALFSGGALLAWGYNAFGQLGNGTTTTSDNPVSVMLPTGAKVRAVGATCRDSYALTAQGHVLAWGDNGSAQLGDDGSASGSSIPVQVDLPNGWAASVLGTGPAAWHALAIVHKARP